MGIIMQDYKIKRIPHRFDLLRLLPKNSVGAEVGVLVGHFSQQILRIVQPSKFYAVDTWLIPYNVNIDQDIVRMTGPKIKETFYKRFEQEIASGLVTPLVQPSEVALTTIPDNYLDWIYIDANHNYNYVLTDLENSLRIVKDGGWICGHDFCEINLFGVVRAVAVFCDRHNLEIVYLTDSPRFQKQGEPSLLDPLPLSCNSYMIKVNK